VIDNTDSKGWNVDYDALPAMLRNLLVERFKLATHMEERPVNACSLVAAKPKMKPADPASRIKCFGGTAGGAANKDPRDTNPVLNRLITCQNMTMDRFAGMLHSLAPGYIHVPVLDLTGLDGAWDFTLGFSGAGRVNGNAGGGRTDTPSAAAGGANVASDPNGAISLLDALPKLLGKNLELNKQPVQVLVMDRIEQKPLEN
jgi:uncharacterized protein (TIGR03435 family)